MLTKTVEELLNQEDGNKKNTILAAQISLIIEGAIVTAQVQGDKNAAKLAKAIVENGLLN